MLGQTLQEGLESLTAQLQELRDEQARTKHLIRQAVKTAIQEAHKPKEEETKVLSIASDLEQQLSQVKERILHQGVIPPPAKADESDTHPDGGTTRA